MVAMAKFVLHIPQPQNPYELALLADAHLERGHQCPAEQHSTVDAEQCGDDQVQLGVPDGLFVAPNILQRAIRYQNQL